MGQVGFTLLAGHDIISKSPVDVQKQIAYWTNGSKEDLDAARDLLAKKHYRHALFLAHLAVEKMLKAIVTERTGKMPPKIHNLKRLSEIAGLELNAERENILAALTAYQIEGRYPDLEQTGINSKTASRNFKSAEGMVKWLRNQLLE